MIILEITLYIAFRVVTSAFLERDGWYIVDIRLTDNPSSIDEIGNLERGLSLKSISKSSIE
jgi:hypothetical protein